MRAPFESVLETRGQTPVVTLSRLTAKEPRAQVALKLEAFNPTGAAQDRLAVALLDEAQRSGSLAEGATVIEASLGNLAVSLAMVCAARGHPFIAVMPESVSPERRLLVKAYGARVELTPAETHLAGAFDRAEALLAQTPGAYRPRAHESPVAVKAYEESLGAELAATARADGGADALVVAVGSGAMLAGTARAMRSAFPSVRVVAAVPTGQTGWGHNAPHHVAGVGVNVALPLLANVAIDRIVETPPEEAVAMQRRLAREEGILAGFSTGLATCAALKVARELGLGRRVYVLAVDSGERYFSLQGYFP